jgi:hypothetical protein
MDEIAPGLLDWAAYRETIGTDVHSHYAVDAGVIFDPMPGDSELPSAPRLAALTNRHHLRFATDYDCPIVCHEAGLHEFAGADVAVEGFRWGDELAPGVRALEVGVLCPEETAMHIATGHGFLAFADAVIRDGSGRLAFVPDSLLGDDPAAIKAGLRAALQRLIDEQEFDGLLLAHGKPSHSGGKAELQALATG